MPAMSRGTKKQKAQPLSCTVCGHPIAAMKGKNGKLLCAACLTLSAKMPCYSGPEKLADHRGLSPCNPKGGGMGLLMTQDFTRFFVKADNFDLVFLDSVDHTRIPFATVDHVLAASADAAMQIQDGMPYWWGILQKNDIYPALEMLRTTPWNITQDTMQFHPGPGEPPRSDTRFSWLAVTRIKEHPEYVRMLKAVKRILEKDEEEAKRQTRLAALDLQQYPVFRIYRVLRGCDWRHFHGCHGSWHPD